MISVERRRLIPNPVAGFTASVGPRPLVGLDVRTCPSPSCPHLPEEALRKNDGAGGSEAQEIRSNTNTPFLLATMSGRSSPITSTYSSSTRPRSSRRSDGGSRSAGPPAAGTRTSSTAGSRPDARTEAVTGDRRADGRPRSADRRPTPAQGRNRRFWVTPFVPARRRPPPSPSRGAPRARRGP